MRCSSCPTCRPSPSAPSAPWWRGTAAGPPLVPAAPARPRVLVSNLHYISKTDSNVVETSWVDDKLVFRDESFENLAADMSRKYGIDIRFSNDDIKKYRFTGIFKEETIEEVLNALQLTEKFNYKIMDSTIYIF